MKKHFTSSFEKVGVEMPHVYVHADGGSLSVTLNLSSSSINTEVDREQQREIRREIKSSEEYDRYLSERKVVEKETESLLKGKFERALTAVHNFAQGEMIQAVQRLEEFDRNYLAQIKGEPVQASIVKISDVGSDKYVWMAMDWDETEVTLKEIRFSRKIGVSTWQKSYSKDHEFSDFMKSEKDLFVDAVTKAMKSVETFVESKFNMMLSRISERARAVEKGEAVQAAIEKVAYDQSELDFSLTGNLYVRIRFPGGGDINIPWGESGLFKDFIDLTTEMENTERGKAMDEMQKFMNALGKEKSVMYSEKLRSASNSLFEYARGLGNKLMAEMKSAFGQKVQELKER